MKMLQKIIGEELGKNGFFDDLGWTLEDSSQIVGKNGSSSSYGGNLLRAEIIPDGRITVWDYRSESGKDSYYFLSDPELVEKLRSEIERRMRVLGRWKS